MRRLDLRILSLVADGTSSTFKVHEGARSRGDTGAVLVFAIGALVWPGISKLLEEAGEVVQVGGKLLGTDGAEGHWDGSNLRTRLEDEIAELETVDKPQLPEAKN